MGVKYIKPDIVIREMELSDVNREILPLFQTLSPGEYDVASLVQAFKERHFSGNIFTFVATIEKTVVGTASIIIERKLVHNGRTAGHIEDVIVSEYWQGAGIGRKLVEHCVDYAKAFKCYKVTLECNNEKERFYWNCGFNTKGIAMRLDIG